MNRCGIVVIGRNEGERLTACLRSLDSSEYPIVYVDSGSSDRSVANAREHGANVVELDMSIPFTAARARNEGFHRLLSEVPDLTFVQFVDGDCVVLEGWLEKGVEFLSNNTAYAIVCGMVRERFPDATVYNRLMAMEWDRPPGDVTECGGIFMIRADAFRKVGGFDPTVIAGEEPELCVRLRQNDWLIRRLSAPMVLHDAAMTRFSQWWKRSVRCGFAYAYGAYLHGNSPAKHWVRESRSAILWGGVIPISIIGLATVTSGWGLLAAAIFPIQVIRIARRKRNARVNPKDAMIYAFFCVIGKVPECVGVLKFFWNRLTGRRNQIIEYKHSSQGTTGDSLSASPTKAI